MYLETDLRIMPPSHWKQTKVNGALVLGCSTEVALCL